MTNCKTQNAARRDPITSLVGKWFHSWNVGGEIEWQGTVLKRVSRDAYLVQLFEWFTGSPNGQRIVPLTNMVRWTFYDTDTEMNGFYEAWEANGRRPRTFNG